MEDKQKAKSSVKEIQLWTIYITDLENLDLQFPLKNGDVWCSDKWSTTLHFFSIAIGIVYLVN